MRKILIVDDEPVILMSLFHLLSSESTLVVTSGKIEEAEEALFRYKFDLVIADIRLSGVDGIEGLELLSYVKQMSPETKVIIMTAYGSEEMENMACERGAYLYLEKPIDTNVLIEAARRLNIEVFKGKQEGQNAYTKKCLDS